MKTIVREKHWTILPENPELQSKFSRELRISPITARILVNRNITNLQDAKNFLSNDIRALYDPFIFNDMEKITKRILSAVKNKEVITIYGDYDADGICGTALLILILQELGAKCRYYLPNRLDEGYGLNNDAVSKCKELGTNLLITVDCGISSKTEIEYAKELGMDVIVTDHHSPVGDLPKCTGILNPKIPGSLYPYKELAGVGVAYKLACALGEPAGRRVDANKHLDLVALGTIADIVPLTGENRILVHHGLKALEKTGKLGLVKLKEKSGIDKNIQTTQVAFRLAPRLNAAGRIATAESSIKLLLAEDETEAEQHAAILNRNNQERQKIEQDVLESALTQLELKFNFNSDKIIVLEDDNWSAGVIGIVAGRIANQYYRPCILISMENGIGKGSGRSIKNFHLLNGLEACREHLNKFGGHSHAAGLSIEKILIQSFREKINQYAETMLKPDDLIPKIEFDAEIGLQDISFNLIEELENLEPYGQNNQRPNLLSSNLELYGDPQIVGKDHLKFKIKSQGRVFEAIGFGMADYISLFDESSTVDIVHRPQINSWMNKQNIQLQIVDLKVS